MSFSASDVRDRLIGRGVELNAGLAPETFDRYRATLGIDVDPAWRELYLAFDGFAGMVMDTRSALCVWPMQRIVDEAAKEPRQDGRLAFADFLLDSDVILADLRDASAALSYEYEGFVVADGLSDFWEKLLSGALDKLKE